MLYVKFCVIVTMLPLAAVNTANILGLFPLKFKSHYIVFDAIMTELAKRGHTVTVVNAFPKTKSIPNFTDVDVDACNHLPDDIFTLDGAYKSHNAFYQVYQLMRMAEQDESFLTCPPIRRLMASNETYDLLITEIFSSDAMLGFVHKFKTPFLSFAAQPMFPWASRRVGNPDNPSYISYTHTPMPLDLQKSPFHQRLFNFILYVYAQAYYYVTDCRSESLKRQYFQFDEPTLNEITKSTSLILTFSHFSINRIEPLVPNVIPVAGLQIQNASILPKNIQKFIDESEHGVIYFSMGSLLRSETMSDEKREAFLSAFAKLPQRVLWKWGDDVLPGKTDKIFISKWMPQRDILAHPKIKVFISHGGALGVNEAVYEGVPILGIPMYADQTLNLKNLESYGAADILEYTAISNESVYSKLKNILKDNEYSKNMKKVSAIFKDRPMSPMDTAIYWIEYVIRHKGAYHLRSAAVDLPLYQYLLLDVILFLLLVLSSVIFTIFFCVRAILRLLFMSKKKVNTKNKKKLQ